MVKKLFVGNLPWSVGNKDLAEAFNPYGKVKTSKMVMDQETGKSRGFGFVEMESAEEAEAAKNALHQSEIEGRKIVVDWARERPKNPGP